MQICNRRCKDMKTKRSSLRSMLRGKSIHHQLLKKDCTFAKNSAQTYFPFRRWQLTQQLTTCRSTPNNNKNWGRRKTFIHYFFISLKRSKPSHSVSKFHFWSKNYKSWKNLKNFQFLFLCQNWLFLAVKNTK